MLLSFFFAARDIKVTRPLYSVEVTETETARFEIEISEDDVHGNWKLKGEALHQSPVRTLSTNELIDLLYVGAISKYQIQIIHLIQMCLLFIMIIRTVKLKKKEISTY